jgi:hypothetical protein
MMKVPAAMENTLREELKAIERQIETLSIKT